MLLTRDTNTESLMPPHWFVNHGKLVHFDNQKQPLHEPVDWLSMCGHDLKVKIQSIELSVRIE